MATKKQKREAAIAKHEAEMAEIRQTGLTAQRKDIQHRRRQELQEWEDNHKKNHSWTKRIKECPHCRIEIHAAKQAEKQSEKQEASSG